MKDFMAKSCSAGATSFLYKNLLNYVLYYLGLTPFLYRVEAATLVLPLREANTLYGLIIGLTTDFILLGWMALLIAYIFNVTGKDYSLIKGAFVGASMWLMIYGFFVHNGMLGLFKSSGISSSLTTLFFDITTGMISAFMLVYLDTKHSELK